MGFVGDIIGEVTGSNKAADAAGKAADTQAAAVEKSNEYLRETRDIARADNMPFLNAGNSGLNRLLYGLGLGGTQSGAAPASQQTADQIRAELLPQFTTAATQGGVNQDEIARRTRAGEQYGLNPANGRYGFYTDIDSSNEGPTGVQRNWNYAQETPGTAGGVNEQALNEAIQARLASQQQQQVAQQQAQGGEGFGSLLQSYKPYEDYKPYEAFTAEKFQVDPGYQFRLDQGNNALTQSLAAGGNLNSGRALKALTDYNSGMASQEFGNAYQRYNNDYTTGFNAHQGNYQTGYNAFTDSQNNEYNKLMGLVGVGQGAGQQISNQGLQTGQQLANNAIQSGNAQAAGQVAQGNAGLNGFNSLIGAAGLGFGAYNAFNKPVQGGSSYGRG